MERLRNVAPIHSMNQITTRPNNDLKQELSACCDGSEGTAQCVERSVLWNVGGRYVADRHLHIGCSSSAFVTDDIICIIYQEPEETSK